MDLEMLLVQECIAVYEDEKKTYNEDKWLDGQSLIIPRDQPMR